MKTNSKRLLSALLAMVMVLSMLVIPAGAAGEAIAAGSYDFKRGKTDGVWNEKDITTTGIDWGGFAYKQNGDDHGPQGSGAVKITTSADKFTTLTVTTCRFGQAAKGKGFATVTVDGADADMSVGLVDEDPVYTIYNAKGEVTLTFANADYIHGVDVVESETATDLHTVEVDSAITGGKVTVNPVGKVPAGTEVTVTATADDGYELVANSVEVSGAAITDGKFTVSADSTVTAQFAAKTEPEVQLDKTAVEVEGGSTVTVAATMKNDQGKTVTWTTATTDNTVATATVANDGTVTVTGANAGTATITVTGTLADGAGQAEATLAVEVWKDPTSWDFTKDGIQAQLTAANAGEFSWRGLTIKGGKAGTAANGAAFFSTAAEADALDAAGSIKIPVSGPSKITVEPSFHWDIQLGTDDTTRKTKDTDATTPLEFTYMGKAGTATLNILNRNAGSEKRTWIKSIAVEALEMCDVTPGCTLLKGHEGSCVVAQPWDGAKIDFQALASGKELPTVTGVTFDGGVSLSEGNSHGLHALSEGAITVKLSAKAVVTVKGCQFGALSAATAMGTNGAIAMPTAWIVGGDPEYVFEDVPAGDFTLNVPKNAWIHSIEADYSDTHTPQFLVTEDCVSTEVGESNVSVDIMTRFADGAKPTLTQNSGSDKATIALSTDGSSITVTPLAEGEATATVSMAGTAESQTFTVLVWEQNKVHTEWKLQTGKWGTKERVDVQKKTGTLRGLTIDATNGKFGGSNLGKNAVQFNAGTIIKVPVNVPEGQVAKVTLLTYTANAITVDGVANKNGNAEGAEEFTCAGIGNVVTITATANTYLGDIKVEYVEGETMAVLELDKASVELQMGKKPTAEVNATVYGSTAELVATSSDENVVTAAVDGNKVTLTAVDANGEENATATVTVKLKDTTNAEATKTIAVTVKPQGKVEYIKEGDYNFQGNPGIWTPDNIETLAGLDTHGAVPQVQGSTGHGLQDPGAGAGTSGTATGVLQLTVSIPEKQKVRLTFEICGYGAGQAVKVTSSNGEEVEHTKLATGHNGGDLRAVVETTGTVTVTFDATAANNKGIWIHSMAVAFLKDDTPEPVADRRIHVWDIAGKAETDTSLYTNHITPETWAAWAASLTDTTAINYAKNGEFPGQVVDLDGLVLTAASASSSQCSVFSTVSGNWGIIAPKTGSLEHEFEDGYTSAGGYMAYGAGGSGRRYITINGVRKGETVVAYVSNNQKDTTFGVEGVEGVSVTTASKGYGILSFIAPQGGNYKIYEPANSGKPAYLRVAVIPPVQVSGSITLPADFDAAEGWGLKFTDIETKAVTMATVDKTAKTYVVELAPGHTYNAALTNARGWGMTSATKSVTLVKTDITAVKTRDLVVEKKEVYDYSGSIVGFAADYDVSELAITMIPDDLSATDGVEDADLTIDKSAMTFTVTLEPSVEYTLELAGVDDYTIKTPEKVSSEGGNLASQTITVETKARQAVSGKLVTLDMDDQFAPLYADSTYAPLTATVSELKFVVVEKNNLGQEVETKYVYPATVADGGYTVNLRPGNYLAKATVNGYATRTHVVVDGKGAVSKDLLFVSTDTPGAVAYAADVYVDGKGGTDLHFKTVTGAMAYIKRMTRTDSQRVTVHIAPGTYREQISIDSKNVTFVNNTPDKEAKITWYYGIGYKYYSASGPSNLERWYDAQNAFDRYEKNNGKGEDVARWGCTVRVQAPGFQAQGITFENSFNYYLTEEEIGDGVETVPTTIAFEREYGADVTSKAATERAAAIWVDTNSGRGDMTEFKSCKFLSSQDTFGTGKRMYLKDCYIEGMTDYICGPGDCVFDTCTLNWKGYSDTEQVAYLTAPQTNASEKGYLFRNCYISGDTKLKLKPNHLGRTWGAANTKCIFFNTTLQNDKMIDNTTWIEMQGFNPANANGTLLEWGTTLLDGTKVDLSKRTLQNTVAKTEPTAKPEDFFAGWVPEYYVKEADTVAFEVEPTITDNGDINTPYPGHTLTVNYSLGKANDANDASVIKWVRVADDGAETVVKTSLANADKTYKITKDDQGAIIKVTVTPTTLSGKTGEAKSIALENKVREGFEDPTGATDPELGDGVNVFLAGDSTVFDYSKGRNEGSWGEFLQNYLDKNLVTVVDHAVGGRSSRSFINEGRLDAIAADIKAGDYLLIQFGHNDCANETDYRVERYAPLGNADANGVYPTTAGTKGSDGKYTWDCGGTYKWYLQQYIDVAKKAGATPILVTPVARLYYNADGTIRPHHDASYATNGSVTDTSKWDTTKDNTKYSNTYVTAVKQLAEENGIACIDAFQFTKDMYDAAYKACPDSDKATYGRQVMHAGDSTHSNKLGGMIQAALMAQAIKGLNVSISKTVKAPTMAQAKTTEGQVVFTVDGKGVFTAYDMLKDYDETAPYWMGVGQELMDALKSDQPGGPTQPVDKAALTAAVAEAKKAVDGIYVVENDVTAADVNSGTKFITKADKAALDAAIAAAEAVLAQSNATEAQLAKAKADLDKAMKAIQTGTKGSGVTPPAANGSRPAGANGIQPTETVVKDLNGNTAKKTTNNQGDVVIVVTDKNGEVLAEINLPASIGAPKTKFKDVPDGHWAAKSINNMAALGMVKGVAEDTYDMTSPMTRGAIATVLFRLANGKEGKTTSFADVSGDAWYTDAVGWAAASGVVTGYSDTAFGPDDTITRQQLAVMITRFMKLAGVDTAAKTDKLSAFADGAATDDWAKESVAWCVENGIMKGKGNDILDPTAAVSRAEAATMLDRAIAALR